MNHYFHDLEWILGLYAWSKYEFKGHPVEAVVYSRQNNSAILRKLLRILFPEADFIQRDRLFQRKSPRPGQSTIIKNAVATDHSYPVSAPIAGMLASGSYSAGFSAVNRIDLTP